LGSKLPTLSRDPADRPSKLRLGILAAITAMFSLMSGWGLLALVAPPEEEPLADAQHEARVQYLPLVREGYELLRQGDPASAASAFRRAVRLAPARPGLRAIRETAEQQAEAFAEMTQREREVAKGLFQASEALSRNRYAEAETAANTVLEIDPDNQEATEIVTAVEEGRARQEEERRRRLAARRARQQAASSSAAAAPPPREPTAQPTAGAPPPAAPPAGQTTTTLTVGFSSQRPEGTLTLFVGEEQLLREPFRFVRRKGFLRSEAYEGQLSFGPFEIKPGATRLRVYVYLAGRPALAEILDAEIAAGSARHLEVTFSEDEVLSARLR
jgi:tetratricopeptide (TPR) repeat protein